MFVVGPETFGLVVGWVLCLLLLRVDGGGVVCMAIANGKPSAYKKDRYDWECIVLLREYGCVCVFFCACLCA